MADNKKKHKDSSGKKNARQANRLARRLTMKINRWRRYQEEISNNKRPGPASRWDTSGLESYVKFLAKVS